MNNPLSNLLRPVNQRCATFLNDYHADRSGHDQFLFPQLNLCIGDA